MCAMLFADLEAQLRGEVQALLALGEKADRAAVPDGMDVPAEIARREQRLSYQLIARLGQCSCCGRASAKLLL